MNVRYIMVGGFATRFHGFNRNTDDLDIWLQDTLENRKGLRRAFAKLGYGDLDIMTEMKGLEKLSFDECFKMASVADLDGVKVPFLHINHLIENKKVVNRPKDQVDVIELEKIRKIRETGR